MAHNTDEAKQAQQLDSVTDVVQEQDMDSAKAQQALQNAFSSSTSLQQEQASNNHDQTTTMKTQIDFIVQELEVTEEMAHTTLQQVMTTDSSLQGDALLTAALRKLVTM